MRGNSIQGRCASITNNKYSQQRYIPWNNRFKGNVWCTPVIGTLKTFGFAVLQATEHRARKFWIERSAYIFLRTGGSLVRDPAAVGLSWGENRDQKPTLSIDNPRISAALARFPPGA